ncbi:uveal autoantigen with coiled-coil domains and ankyrin repeats [Plakobranchus ocellatus]|uniref:Uveal autoantigen with coiled-coil domains and ankyrin repeats n=1 Tax=Plakobranchus ocellatus TaxID=259542 RepID=A0AAV4C3C7_9GAST|nr:uveal autoantigen with coiled-coil domains and ankyrin repeats [Plakobranchus ocellatus]
MVLQGDLSVLVCHLIQIIGSVIFFFCQVKNLQDRLAQPNSLPNGEQGKLRTEGNNNEEGLASTQEIIGLKKQVAKLSSENEEWEKRYVETVNTYRTHLLSAVQGHMDPDVKDALYQIIELRSMEQFC